MTAMSDHQGAHNQSPAALDRPGRSSVSLFYLSALLSFVSGSMFIYIMVLVGHDVLLSERAAGVLYFAGYAPLFALAVYGGALSDRYSRRLVAAISQSGSVVIGGLIAAIMWESVGGSALYGILLALALINGVSFAFLPAARYALVADVVAREQLGRATMALNLISIVGISMGPAIVGTMREHMSWGSLYAVTAAVMAVSTGLLWALRAPEAGEVREADMVTVSQVFGLIAARRDMAMILVLAAAATMSLGPVQVLLPEFARTALGLPEIGRGALMAVVGGGMLMGGVVALLIVKSSFNAMATRIVVLIAANVVLVMLLPSLRTVFGVATATAAAAMTGSAAANLAIAGLQLEVPDRLRARMLGVYAMINLGAPGIAGLLAGWLASHIGISGAFRAVGITAFTAMVVAVLWAGKANLSRLKPESPL